MLNTEFNSETTVGVIGGGIAAVTLIVVVIIQCVCGDKPKRTGKRKDEEDIKLDGIQADARQSVNSEVEETVKKNGTLNDRDSKKDRALPELPPANTNAEEIPYADADVDYDTISKEQRLKIRDRTPDGYNPYTSVEGSGDGTYTVVKEQRPKDSSYSHVKGASRENLYAKVDGEESAQSSASAVVAIRQSKQDSATYASVAPPIPDKNFDGDESSFNAADTSQPADGATGGEETSSPSSVPIVQKEPPYISVTARESLTSIRAREMVQKEQEVDFYETVKEDEETNIDITRPPVPTSQRSPLAKVKMERGAFNTNSMTGSDFYAEINTTDESSSGSYMYATVAQRDSTVPVPPSVDALRKISHAPQGDSEIDDDESEPGYTKVRRQDNTNVFSFPGNLEDDHERKLSQMYAVVDKVPKRSKTLPHDYNTDSTGHLYSQVNKDKPKHRYDNVGVQRQNQPSVTQGIAPKMTMVSDIDDPGYDTVKETDNDAKTKVQDDCSELDPYSSINETSDSTQNGVLFDPSYATVEDVQNESGTADNSSLAASNVSPAMVHIGRGVQPDVKFPRKEHVYQEIEDAKLDQLDKAELLNKLPVTYL